MIIDRLLSIAASVYIGRVYRCFTIQYRLGNASFTFKTLFGINNTMCLTERELAMSKTYTKLV